MKESNVRIIKFFVVIVMVLTVFLFGEAKASFADDLSISGIFERGRSFISQGEQSATVTEDSLIDSFLPIGKILVAVATATVFVVTAIMGVKWITASPDQQATLKKQLIGLVVAIVVIYGAVGIWTFVRNLMVNLTA